MFTCSTAKATGQMLVDGTPSGIDGNVDAVERWSTPGCASIRPLVTAAGGGCGEISRSPLPSAVAEAGRQPAITLGRRPEPAVQRALLFACPAALIREGRVAEAKTKARAVLELQPGFTISGLVSGQITTPRNVWKCWPTLCARPDCRSRPPTTGVTARFADLEGRPSVAKSAVAGPMAARPKLVASRQSASRCPERDCSHLVR